jgi:hypothetical protein
LQYFTQKQKKKYGALLLCENSLKILGLNWAAARDMIDTAETIFTSRRIYRRSTSVVWPEQYKNDAALHN